MQHEKSAHNTTAAITDGDGNRSDGLIGDND